MQSLVFKIFSISLEYRSVIFQTPRLAADSIHRIFCISRVRKHLTLDPDLQRVTFTTFSTTFLDLLLHGCLAITKLERSYNADIICPVLNSLYHS